MKLLFQSSYAFELLSFLNVLTADPFYTNEHPAEYRLFSDLTDASREKAGRLVEAFGRANLAFPLNLLFAAAAGHRGNTVYQVLQMNGEMERIIAAMREYPYIPAQVLDEAPEIFSMVGDLARELEQRGFRAY